MFLCGQWVPMLYRKALEMPDGPNQTKPLSSVAGISLNDELDTPLPHATALPLPNTLHSLVSRAPCSSAPVQFWGGILSTSPRFVVSIACMVVIGHDSWKPLAVWLVHQVAAAQLDDVAMDRRAIIYPHLKNPLLETSSSECQCTVDGFRFIICMPHELPIAVEPLCSLVTRLQ